MWCKRFLLDRSILPGSFLICGVCGLEMVKLRHLIPAEDKFKITKIA